MPKTTIMQITTNGAICYGKLTLLKAKSILGSALSEIPVAPFVVVRVIGKVT